MTDDTQTPGLIPDQLLSNIKKGDCVLFLGADLPLGYEGAPLSQPELAAALAKKHGLPSGLLWPETAQAYLGQFTNDRHGLISFVAERCSGPHIQPGPLHEAIARAGFRAIVTALPAVHLATTTTRTSATGTSMYGWRRLLSLPPLNH